MSQRNSVIPGFGLSLGYTLFYLTLLVLIPLGGLILRTTRLSWGEFWAVLTDPIVFESIKLSFRASLLAALINSVFGVIVAWVLVRYHFPGRRIFDAVVDFPFALPTAVAGLTLGNLYSADGWIGGLGGRVAANLPWLWWTIEKGWGALAWVMNHALDLVGATYQFGPARTDFLAFGSGMPAITVALVFVGLPFVVRTIQPVLQDWDFEVEQAAQSLGAGRFTIFRRLIFAEVFPAWLSGLALAFARAVGEYGSVIFVAGNIPGQSQIAPLQIVTKLDDFQYAHATAIGVVLLAISLAILLLLNGLDWFARRHERAAN